MTQFGLSEEDLKCILKILRSYPQIEDALIFGSRALNRYKNGSDVDIALKGDHLSELVTKIAGQLNDNTHLPYKFDVVNYQEIENEDFKDHIDRVGISIF